MPPPASQPADGLLLALRRHTAEDHARLDAAVGDVDDEFTLQDLRRLVDLLRRGDAHYRRAVTRFAGELARLGATWTPTDRSAELAADATALALPPPEPGIADPRLDPGSLDQFIGMAYVFEGSALGAAHLAPLLRERLGPDAPLAHFEAAAAEGLPRWAQFRTFVRELPDGAIEADRVLDAAAATFRALGDLLAARTS